MLKIEFTVVVVVLVLQELQHLRKPISKSQKHLSSCTRAKFVCLFVCLFTQYTIIVYL